MFIISEQKCKCLAHDRRAPAITRRKAFGAVTSLEGRQAEVRI